ncbi:ribosome-recycling factor [Mucilaginibacter ginsenosidivorax]|uniref:Ribosome-recycling factor n=1 Tax=Mucilaginibacter ginsenosidivorax TaxID=862126 RepID=A0A5B8W773_9SPHI|nr:ribosome-recycling factor [Mucilaginibacter ginsenosidivorax]QEC78776.1 ribosome-recycling factor [Mucilaginibacter ginsenosidivorax]
MATTFDDIIDRLNKLAFENWGELHQIEELAVELIKRCFPDDFTNEVRRIRGIIYKPRRGSELWRDPGGNPVEAWNGGVGKFKGIIIAKKETYSLQTSNGNTVEKETKENSRDAVKKLFAKVETEHKEKIAKLDAKLTSKEAELKSTFQELSILKSKVKKFDITYVVSIATIAGVVLYIGYFWGNNRFDAEKLSMRDSIISLQHQNQILKKQIVPFIKPVKP